MRGGDTVRDPRLGRSGGPLSVRAWVLAGVVGWGGVGCIGFSNQTEGNPIEPELLERIVVGETTRAEILEWFGSPLRIDRADITGLAERVLSRYQGEALTLQIDPSLFNDVYIYERREIERFGLVLGIVNVFDSDERSDRLSVFFDREGKVLGVGWTPGREEL